MNLDFERKEEINYSIIIPHKNQQRITPLLILFLPPLINVPFGYPLVPYTVPERCSGNSGR